MLPVENPWTSDCVFQTKTSDRKDYTCRQDRRTGAELTKEKGRENAPSYVNAKVHPDRGNTPAPARLGLQNSLGGQKVLEMYRFYWIGHWWSASLTGITRPLANAPTGAHERKGARLKKRQRQLGRRVASHTFLSSSLDSSSMQNQAHPLSCASNQSSTLANHAQMEWQNILESDIKYLDRIYWAQNSEWSVTSSSFFS